MVYAYPDRDCSCICIHDVEALFSISLSPKTDRFIFHHRFNFASKPYYIVSIVIKRGQIQGPERYREYMGIILDGSSGETSTTDLGGGMIGAVLFALCHYLFDEAGTKLIAAVLIMIGFVLLTGKTFGDALGKIFSSLGKFIKNQWSAFLEDVKNWRTEHTERKMAKRQRQEEKMRRSQEEEEQTTISGQPEMEMESTLEPIISSFTERAYQEHAEDSSIKPEKESTVMSEQDSEDDTAPPMTFTEVENMDYELPPVSLLKLPQHTDQSREYKLIHQNAAKLERTFQSFGVKARVTQVHLGPAVTKYEVHPDVGVKVSKIVSLSDDLALALAAKDIRIEAPIPGKSAIGIEVPNSEVAMVSLREVLESKQNDKPESKLLIGLGRDITGKLSSLNLIKCRICLLQGQQAAVKVFVLTELSLAF